ncbi:MAG: hypothetical protein RL701_255 [Pseudomonadota bacterium]|jgi:uncharacterized protein YbcV (DUF1398 family)
MDSKTRDTIERCAAESHAGAITFGDVVNALRAHGVESYRVDYRLRATYYYLPAGDTYSLTLPNARTTAMGEAFDIAALQAAIRGAQRNEVKYPEFVERSMHAGCVGYVVWITGGHVSYFGRRGETLVEPFPAAPTKKDTRARASAVSERRLDD